MAAQTVERRGEHEDAAPLRHADEQVTIFPKRASLTVSAHFLKRPAPEHGGPVREWWDGSSAEQGRTVPCANDPPSRIDGLCKGSHQADIGVGVQDLPLEPQPIRMRNVVRIHPGTDRRSSFRNHPVGAADYTELAPACDDTDPVVASGPVAQDRGSLIGRGVIQNDELEVVKGLAHNAVDAFLQIVSSVVDGHHNAESRWCSRCSQERPHTSSLLRLPFRGFVGDSCYRKARRLRIGCGSLSTGRSVMNTRLYLGKERRRKLNDNAL